MNIQELIEKLQDIQKEHGNLPVYYSDYEDGETDVSDIQFRNTEYGWLTKKTWPKRVIII